MRTGSQLRAFLGGQAGSSAVEFAIVALPLFLLAFGTLEFGRFLWIRNALQQTAFVAARCMGVTSPSCSSGGTADPTQTRNYALDVARSWYVPLVSTDIVPVAGDTTCPGLSSAAKVTISHAYQTAVPILLGSFRDGVLLKGEACFPNQADAS